jgi:mycofactocin precursor
MSRIAVESRTREVLMSQPKPEPTPDSEVAEPSVDELVEADLLVEDVSIDGMCGVY